MDISFDNRGFLQPAELIEMNLNEIEQYFITGFPTETSRRYLWTELLRFLDDFSNLITQDYDCWIDGSFISKKWSPQDIDVLIELHYQDFEDKGILLQKQFIQHSFESNYKGIDAYILKKYPSNHLKYSHYLSDFAYWNHLFSKTKPNRNQKSFSKGFIKLIQ